MARKDSKGRVLKSGEYERKNQIGYEYKYTDKAGKRRSISAITLKKLREKEMQIQKNTIMGLQTGAERLTLNNLFDVWYDTKKGIRDNTKQNYYYMYNQYIKYDYGDIRITKLKKIDIKKIYNYLFENVGLKISTIDIIHNILYQLLDIAVDSEYIIKNPAKGALKDLKQARNLMVNKNDKVKFLSKKQEERLIEYISKKNSKYYRWYPVIQFMLATGLRIGECAGLRWTEEDINLDKNEIYINHTLVNHPKEGGGGNEYRVNPPKTKAGNRTVPMTSKAKKAILQEKEIQKMLGIKCNVNIEGYHDFIFLNRFGKPIHQGIINKTLKRIVRDGNFDLQKREKFDQDLLLPNISSHMFRHTFTTRMNEAGVNPKVQQTILGHENYNEVTYTTYTHLSESFKTKEIQKIEEM